MQQPLCRLLLGETVTSLQETLAYWLGHTHFSLDTDGSPDLCDLTKQFFLLYSDIFFKLWHYLYFVWFTAAILPSALNPTLFHKIQRVKDVLYLY